MIRNLLAKLNYWQNDCEVDFKKLNVFCVERDNWSQTCIGYLDKDGVAEEWFISCSFARHQKLVEQFRKVTQP